MRDPHAKAADAMPATSAPMRGHALNRRSYNAIAPLWDAARCALRGREAAYLAELMRTLPAPARILDLGCGTGRPLAEQLLAHGHALTGVDQAESLLSLARARFPQATWVHAGIEAYVAPAGFDAIVCWDALFHIERSMHARLLERWARMLASGGRLMLTVGGSAHPAFTDTMFGRRFYYDSHPPATVLALLDGLGFRADVAELTDRPTGGRDKGRFAVLATRR